MKKYNIDLDKIKEDYGISGDILYWDNKLRYYRTLNNSSDLDNIDIERMEISEIVPYEVSSTYVFDMFHDAFEATNDVLEEARVLLNKWSLEKGLTGTRYISKIDLNKYMK